MVALNQEEAFNAPDMAEIEQAVEMSEEEKKIRIQECFARGKRDYITEQNEKAVEHLGEAAELCVEVFGPFAVECFDIHLYYGKALLEIGRAEEDLLKTAMTDIPGDVSCDESMDEDAEGDTDNLTEDERTTIKEQVDDALAENAEELDAASGEKKKNSSNDEDKVETIVDSSSQTTDEKIGIQEVMSVVKDLVENAYDSTVKNDDATTTDDEDGDGGASEQNEEEASTIQTAWEALEVARKICEEQVQGKEWDLKKADVLIVLGDCSIEDGNYKQAKDDLLTALTLVSEHLSGSDSSVAEIYLALARAASLNNEYEEAAGYYTKSKESLLGHIETLSESISTESDNTNKNKLTTKIATLKEVVSDLDLKIQDANESAKQIESKASCDAEAKKETQTNSLIPAKSDEPAQDITNLIRKAVKRPPSAGEESSETVKRAKSNEP